MNIDNANKMIDKLMAVKRLSVAHEIPEGHVRVKFSDLREVINALADEQANEPSCNKETCKCGNQFYEKQTKGGECEHEWGQLEINDGYSEHCRKCFIPKPPNKPESTVERTAESDYAKSYEDENCTESERIAYCNGWWRGIEAYKEKNKSEICGHCETMQLTLDQCHYDLKRKDTEIAKWQELYREARNTKQQEVEVSREEIERVVKEFLPHRVYSYIPPMVTAIVALVKGAS